MIFNRTKKKIIKIIKSITCRALELCIKSRPAQNQSLKHTRIPSILFAQYQGKEDRFVGYTSEVFLAPSPNNFLVHSIHRKHGSPFLPSV